MNLIGTARALDDQDFVWRVNAACLITAGVKAVSTTNNADRNYARAVLLSPMYVDPSMLAFVAIDAGISAKIKVEGGTVDTSAVTDEEIVAAVTGAWSKVAVKYTSDPFSNVPGIVRGVL